MISETPKTDENNPYIKVDPPSPAESLGNKESNVCDIASRHIASRRPRATFKSTFKVTEKINDAIYGGVFKAKHMGTGDMRAIKILDKRSMRGRVKLSTWGRRNKQ